MLQGTKQQGTRIPSLVVFTFVSVEQPAGTKGSMALSFVIAAEPLFLFLKVPTAQQGNQRERQHVAGWQQASMNERPVILHC